LALFVIVFAASAFAGDLRDKPSRTELPSARVAVPMELRDVQPVVEVRVNGQGPFRFLVDTGAAGCGRISAPLADRLGLEVVGEVIASDPSGQNRETVKLVGVDSIYLGEAKFFDLSMLRRDNKMFIDEQRAGIDGILGFGLFHDCMLTLDYPGGKLMVERGELSPGAGRSVLSYRAGHGIPEVTLKVGGLKVDTDIDSGSMGSLSLPESVAEKLEFKREPTVVGRASTGFNDFEIKEAPLDGAVHVGAHVIEDPIVAIYDIFPRANMGGQLLQEFSLTFDQHNQTVRFARNEPGPIKERPRYRVGVMMVPGAEGFDVEGVVPGSPAEKAGLKPGDRITQVNGQSLEKLGRGGMSKIFHTPEPIKLTVDRDGEQHEVTVTPVAVE
jgi:hypothetical protein